MNITRDLLVHAAQDYVNRSVAADRCIAAVYLIGSVLTEDPLLGGTTDIDLVFIHSNTPSLTREIYRFTDEISLDILHHNQSMYDQPRLLRDDPILGPPINTTRSILHDTQHWFEYTQAIVTAQFARSDHSAERVRKLAADARSEWLKMEQRNRISPKEMSSFLGIVKSATNAIASITGMPLAERRFMLHLAEACQAVDNPQLSMNLSALLGFADFDFSVLENWISIWEKAFSSVENPSRIPPEVHPHRKLYYINAVKSFFNEGQLESCLWIILSSWTTLAAHQSSKLPTVKDYLGFISTLGFNKKTYMEKNTGLDGYLESCEEIIKNWALSIGA